MVIVGDAPLDARVTMSAREASAEYAAGTPFDLSKCANEAIHLLGGIQSHGALVAVTDGELIVRVASTNAGDLLGVESSALIGTSLAELLGARQCEQLRQSAAELAGRATTLLTVTMEIRNAMVPFDLSVHRADGLLVCEFEPTGPEEPAPVAAFYPRVRALLLRFQELRTVEQLCALAVTEIRAMTGYDRVVVCRFDEDGPGEVIAEALRPDMDPWLGLWFPASDVPSQARRLYLHHWIRSIGDVDGRRVALEPPLLPDNGRPLDLSGSVLRRVSEYHLEYLRSIGVKASMSVSLVRTGRLWGLIACHSDQPLLLNAELRAVCEFFGMSLSLQMTLIEERRHEEESSARQATLSQFAVAVATRFPNSLLDCSARLMELVAADGLYLRLGETAQRHGVVPDDDLLDVILRAGSGGPERAGVRWYSDRLGDVDPVLNDIAQQTSGALVLPLTERGDVIAWFRSERLYEVPWAVDPERPVVTNARGQRLSPRGSSAVWQETIRGCSIAWSRIDHDAVDELWRSVLDMKLRQAEQERGERERIATELFERELADARDAAVEASRQKSEFLATMSHEIRTPMNGVIGLTGLLLRRELDDTARHYAERIRIAGKTLLTVINDILDFSKIEAGALILDRSPVNLSAVVENVLELVAESARAKGLELVGHCDPRLPDHVGGDGVRIRQILLNLAVNAVKFTDHGEIFIHIRPTSEAPTDPGPIVDVRLEVTDTGIGIPAEQHERLFDAFAQADSSTTRRFGGTGLGLAICHRLAEAMGGRIGVDSQVGIGSVFWCELPLHREHAATQLAFRNSLSLKDVRLLVVDDNEISRAVLTEQGRAWGMAVTAVASGDEAVGVLVDACAHHEPFEVSIIDLQMPEPDGLQLAAAITGNTQILPLPIVLMSADAPPTSAEIADLRITATITKPIQQSQLYDCLIEAVAGLHERAPAAELRPAAIPNGQRLLLAEDNETNQIVGVGVLQELGYQVDVAADGLQTLDLLSRNTYRAVIMDCQMPNMDGYEAAIEIRRREAHTTMPDGSPGNTAPQRIPIIAMTAAALKDDRDRCYAAGMDDYLSKPFDPADLATAVHRWVDDTVARGPAQPIPAPGDVDITERLDRLRGHLPPAGIDRLVAFFLRDAQQCITDLRAAAEQADADTLARTAHTLKGAASSIGAATIAALCESLEQRATAAGAAETIDQLETQYEHARNLLQTITSSTVAR